VRCLLISVETETLRTRLDPSTGRKCVNQYVILHELGKGQHGVVRLGRDTSDQSLWVSRSSPQDPLGVLELLVHRFDLCLPFPLSTILDDQSQQAVKIVNRQQKKRLPGFSSTPKPAAAPAGMEDKLKKEIAILKKLRHPHVVRLREVIDAKDSPKIFLSKPCIFFSTFPVLLFVFAGELKLMSIVLCLVLEYMEGGEVKWKANNGSPLLTTEQTRGVFRDVVLGLEYCEQIFALPSLVQ
jgi:serine/threonine protein kinase